MAKKPKQRSRLKPWPKSNKTVPFTDLVEPIRKAIEFAYRLERQHAKQSIPWKGLTHGDRVLVTNPNPRDMLSAESLEFEMEDQGRDALDTILATAAQLGIEQGRRMALEELQSIAGMTKTYMRAAKDCVDDLARRVGEKKR